MNKKKIMKWVILVAIIIIPVMYSFFYLKAFWDPYGNLKDMKIDSLFFYKDLRQVLKHQISHSKKKLRKVISNLLTLAGQGFQQNLMISLLLWNIGLMV